MSLLVTRADRMPILRFLRREFWEPGIQVAIYSDLTRAPNGDGVPGDGTIDYTTPITIGSDGNPGPVPIFAAGTQLVPFGGGFGAGPYAAIRAGRAHSGGYGGGPYGGGAYGVGGSWFTWQFPFPLRDGVYQVARVLADRLGNLADPPGDVTEMEVAALPRPPSDLRLAVSGVTVTATWQHSPEFAATE